jgi:quinol monooxygenase YgiN
MTKNIIIGICLLLGSIGVNRQKKDKMEEIVVLTRFEVKAGHGEKSRQTLYKYVKRAFDSKNNIMAEAYYEEQDSSVMWVMERWYSQRAFEEMRNDVTLRPAKTFCLKDLEPLSKEKWRKEPMKEDMPIIIMLFVDCKAGTEGNFKEVYHTAMPKFRSEPGVISYQLSQLLDDSTQFVTYEKFRNEAAFRYHLSFPPIQPVIDYLNSSIKKQPFQAGLHRLIRFAPSGK